MRHYKPKAKGKVTHFAHRPAEKRRPVSMKANIDIGVLAVQTNAKNDGEFNQQMTQRLKEAGEIVAEYCRLEAGKFSTRIPLTVQVKIDDESVYILSGGHAAPNAYPFDPPSFPPVYHPVWGKGPRSKWHWAAQPYRPFLEAGAERGGDKAAEQFANIIDDWSKEIGTDRP